jgi:hypothetical protein
VQDNPYQYFKAGMKYTIREDSPVAAHFRPLQELSKKESERIMEEGPPPGRPVKAVAEKKGGVRITVPDNPVSKK